MPTDEHDLIPTPAVGTLVQFFGGRLPPADEADADILACAAVVVAIHGQPGHVALRILGGSGKSFRRDPGFVDVALWHEHPLASDPNNSNVVNGGTFRYAPTDDLAHHRRFLAKQEENRIAAEKQRKLEAEQEELRKNKLAERRLDYVASRNKAHV